MPDEEGPRRADRPMLFGDALLLTTGAFVILTGIVLAIQFLAGMLALPDVVADVLDPLTSDTLLSDEIWQVYSYAAGLTALLGALGAWWLHGRQLRWAMAIGFVAGLAVIVVTLGPLVWLAARATAPRGVVPLWAMALWGVAFVVQFAFVVWTFADAVRDLRAPIKLHRRLDWLRIASVLLLLLLIVAVLAVLIMDWADGAGRAFTLAVMLGYIAGFMVFGGDVVTDWLERRAARSARIESMKGPGPAILRLTPELAGRLQKRFDKLARRRAHHHVVCAVESLDGSFNWVAASGEADSEGTPMTADTPYFIASIDKLYIATAILKLVEQGRVHLDEPIATYLPGSLVAGIHVMKNVDRSGEINVRHLLGHTSGLPDYLEETPKGNHSLLKQIVKIGDRSWDTAEAMAIVRDGLFPHFEPQPPDAKKTKVRYSDTNYLLLIAILETLHGKPLHEVFAEQIFRPLGMRHTWMLGMSEPLHAPAGPSAALWFGKKPLDRPQALTSLRSTYSTLADQVASLRAIVQGELFEDPTTFALMQRDWKRFAPPLSAAAMRAPSWPIEYGLGMMRFELPGFMTPLGKVPEVIGHTGSTGSWLFYCPALELIFAGTVDQATAGPAPFRFVPRLLNEIVHELHGGTIK